MATGGICGGEERPEVVDDVGVEFLGADERLGGGVVTNE